MFNLIAYSVAALLAGVLTFLAPCTLPLLPAYVAYAGTTDRNQILHQTIYFCLGITLVLTLLGLLAGSLGQFVTRYKVWLLVISGILFILFGIASLFNIELVKPLQARQGKGYFAFLFGGILGLTWTGCVGPMLGVILLLAANATTAVGGGFLLFVYSLGITLPFLLFSGILYKLPKDGRVWKVLRGKLIMVRLFGKERYIHTTNLVSGILFIALGVLFIMTTRTDLMALTPWASPKIFSWEDRIMDLFHVH